MQVLPLPAQRQQLAIPSYKIKKERWEAKKLESFSPKDSEALIDPATVSVIDAVLSNPLLLSFHLIVRKQRKTSLPLLLLNLQRPRPKQILKLRLQNCIKSCQIVSTA